MIKEDDKILEISKLFAQSVIDGKYDTNDATFGAILFLITIFGTEIRNIDHKKAVMFKNSLLTAFSNSVQSVFSHHHGEGSNNV